MYFYLDFPEKACVLHDPVYWSGSIAMVTSQDFQPKFNMSSYEFMDEKAGRFQNFYPVCPAADRRICLFVLLGISSYKNTEQ